MPSLVVDVDLLVVVVAFVVFLLSSLSGFFTVVVLVVFRPSLSPYVMKVGVLLCQKNH